MDIDKEGYALIEQKNKFCVGDEIEIMKPSGENVMVKVLDMKNEKGEKVESCPHPGELVRILLSEKPEIMNLIRVKEESK